MSQSITQFPDNFVDAPTHRITCYFKTLDDYTTAMEKIRFLGVQENDLYILEGQSGIDALDVDGADHGFFATIMRGLQSLSAADDDLRYIETRLKQGDIFLGVPASDEDYREHVHQIMRETNGTDIRYWGHLFIEELSWADENNKK